MLKCTLCEGSRLEEIALKDDLRSYFFCFNCNLIFVNPDFHLSKDAEKSRYSQHHNSIDQHGYVKFLNRAIEPSLAYVNEEMKGLDYGCGPSPTLSKLLRLQGITCFDYDPIFEIDHPYRKYDFVFATECFEHFFFPKKDLQKISSLLRKDGTLSVMTERWSSLEDFNVWYYKNDPTHVSFYHYKTFEFIADAFSYEIVYNDERSVVILKKRD